MTAGVAGLAAWSFMMATGHGAGLMLLPAPVPLCMGRVSEGGGSLLIPLAAVALHTATLLATTGLVALAVHGWVGLAVLRRGWINFDRLWTGALAAAGLLMIVTA